MYRCSIDTLLQLEELNFDLQSHCHALRLLVDDDDAHFSDIRSRLLLERIVALEKTVAQFLTLENALQL